VRLEEDEGVLGGVDVAEILAVLGVVEPDADDLGARDHRCEQPRIRKRHPLAGGGETGEHRIAGEHDQVVIVDDAEPWVASRAETCDSHAESLAPPAARSCRRATGYWMP